jgi:hypothetical protein
MVPSQDYVLQDNKGAMTKLSNWKLIILLNINIDSMISILITLAIGAYKYISFPDHTFFS